MKAFYLLIFCTICLASVHAEPDAIEQDLSPSREIPSLIFLEETQPFEENTALLDEEFQTFQKELSQFNDASTNEEPIQAAQEPMDVQPILFEASPSSLPKPLKNPLISDAADTSSSLTKSGAVPNAVTLETIEPAPISTTLSPTESSLTALDLSPLNNDQPATRSIETPLSESSAAAEIQVDLNRAFQGSPVIYLILFSMSMTALFVWLYSLFSLKQKMHVPAPLLNSLQGKLTNNNFDDALSLCQSNNTLFCKMIASGIRSRRYGLSVMLEAMKAEGKRSSVGFWQKIGLLNDIAIIAPMLGLLGTVLGMFYAFYDVNRSIESMTTLFDGLGISVGTTVAGLIVAIFSLFLHSVAKYRLVNALAHVENQVQSTAASIDDHTSLHK